MSKIKRRFLLLNDIRPDNWLIIEKWQGTKYAVLTYDLIKANYNLTKQAQKEIDEILVDYIEKHGKQHRKIGNQFFGAGATFNHIRVLKEDAENIEKSILTIINNKDNLVKIGICK